MANPENFAKQKEGIYSGNIRSKEIPGKRHGFDGSKPGWIDILMSKLGWANPKWAKLGGAHLYGSMTNEALLTYTASSNIEHEETALKRDMPFGTKAVAVPLVFISYSHDSEQHKEWVRQLATRLAENGVHVIFDQWDLMPGGDVTLFMERMFDADSVIVVCTDRYVSKAEGRKGGVGYEGSIITAKLVEDAGTNKFIPVVRNVTLNFKTPSFLASKLYVDMSEGANTSAAFELLLRRIHEQPPADRPPLGPNPYAKR